MTGKCEEFYRRFRQTGWIAVFVLGLGLSVIPVRADLALVSGALISAPDAGVFVFDTTTNELVDERTSPSDGVVGYFSLAAASDPGLVVAGSANVDGIDVFRGGQKRFFSLSDTPVWVAFTHDGSKVFVSTFSSLERVDLETGEVRVVLDRGMAGLAVSPDGSTAYAVFNGTVTPPEPPSLVAVDTATETVVGRTQLGGAFSLFSGVTVSPDGSRVYVIDNSPSRPMYVVDPAAQSVVAEITFDEVDAAYHSTFGPDPTRLYVSTRDGAAIVDTVSNTVIEKVDLDFFHTAIDVDAAGEQVYVLGAAGGLFVLDAETLEELDFLRVPGGEIYNSNQFIVEAP